jgi:hypothetical protein
VRHTLLFRVAYILSRAELPAAWGITEGDLARLGNAMRSMLLWLIGIPIPIIIILWLITGHA